MELIRNLRGRGGGKPKSPKRTADTLRADDTVEILLAISEGPINGIRNKINPEKDFLVSGTPVQSPVDNWNYEGFVVEQYPGDPISPTPVAMALGGFGNNTTVNVPLATGVAITRTTSTGNIDAIDVRLRLDALYLQNDKGVFEDTFIFSVQYREQGSSTWLNGMTPAPGETEKLKIKGKTTRPVPIEIRIPVTRTTNPYEVKVYMWNSDVSTTNIISATWESFQEIDNQPRSYPGTALVRFMGKATDQFTSIPTLEGIYEGRILRVPTTYDPETKTYSGVWDGSWKLAFCDETAWVLADMITNPRYGYQKYNPFVTPDWASFYECALKANVRVSDGLGGERRKHTFNEVLADARAGKAALAYVAGTMNCVIYDDGTGKYVLAMDSDDPIEQVFVPQSVTEDHFNYSFTDVNDRYNQITGTFINQNLDWEPDRRMRQLDESIEANGVIPHDFIAVGCTNEAELLAAINYKLLTANTETIQLSFRCPRNGFLVRPYGVIGIGDPNMGWGLTGRIKSIVGNTINLRDPLYFETAGTKTMTIQSQDGVREVEIEVAAVGETLTFERTGGDVIDDLFAHAAFVIGDVKPFRVLKVSEVDGMPDFFDIYAVEINRAKYTDMLEVDLQDVVNGSNLDRLQIEPPTAVEVEVKHIPTSAGIVPKFQIGWVRSTTRGVKGYNVYASRNGEPEQLLGFTTGNSYEWVNPPSGIYIINVMAKSMLGTTSLPAYPESPLDFTDDSPVDSMDILGLQVDTGGTSFAGSNPQFVWTSTGIEEARAATIEGSPTPLPLDDTTLRDYRVRIFTTGDVLLRTEFTDQPRYLYTLDKNVEDGGPRRSFKIGVSIRDVNGNFGPESLITASNDLPAVPDVTVQKLVGGFELKFSQPDDTDFRGIQVWMSTTAGFTPGPGNLVFVGAGNATLPGTIGTTYYLRYAAFDEFGKTGLTLSSELTVALDRTVAQVDLDPTLSTLINTHTTDILANATNIANEIIRASAAEGAIDTRVVSMEVSSDKALNGNPVYRRWTNSSNPPDGWTSVGTVNRTRVAGAPELSLYANQEVSTTNVNAAHRYDISITPGWYVVEADIIFNSGSLSGAGVYIDGGGNIIIFRSTPDINGQVLGYTPTTGRRYKWRVLYKHTDTTTARYILGCTAHSTFGETIATVRSITWENLRIRPAEAGEVENGIARNGLASLSARFTDVATTAATATAAVATRTTSLEVTAQVPNALPDRVSVRANFTNVAPTTPLTSVLSNQGTVVTAANEGEVVELTGSTQVWWSRGVLALNPGATYRYSCRNRATVDGTANVTRIGWSVFDSSGTALAHTTVAQNSRVVANGWVTDTFEISAATILASYSTGAYIRPFVRMSTNTSAAYSGSTTQVSFLRLENITDVKTLEASITSVQTALVAADTAIVSSVTTLTASVKKAVLPTTFADPTFFTSQYTSNPLTVVPADVTEGTFVNVADHGKVWQSGTTAAHECVAHKGVMQLIAGHSYRLAYKFRAVTDSSNGNPLYRLRGFQCFDRDGASLGGFWPAGAFTTYVAASGWMEESQIATATAILASVPNTCYIRPLFFKWSSVAPADGQVQVEYLSGTDVTYEENIQAQVTVSAGAIATLEGKMNAFYSIDVSTSTSKAGFVISAGDVSYFDIYADRFRVWDGTGRQQVFTVQGVDVVFNGAIYSDKGVYLGAGVNKWPLGLASKDFLLADGDTLTYGVPLPATPNFVFDYSGAAPLAAGETYNFYADGATTTSAVMRFKISTPGATTAYTKGPTNTDTGGTPKFVLSKGADPDANSNLYVFTVQITHTFTVTSQMQNNPIELQVVVPVYSKKAGVFTYEGSVEIAGSTSYATTGSKTWIFDGAASIVLQSAPTDFGIHNATSATFTWYDSLGNDYTISVSPTVSRFTSVAWSTTSASGTRSATPSGQKCIVKVIPKN